MTFKKGHTDSRGEKNGYWKGDGVGYAALHNWVRRRLVKPTICPKCGRKGWIELSNKSHQYKRDLTDWEYLCRSCHSSYDHRIKNFHGRRGWSKQNRRVPRKCLYCNKEFTIVVSALKRGSRGKFCSRLCTDKGKWVVLYT